MFKLFIKLKSKIYNNSYINKLKKRGLKIGENVQIIESDIDYGHCFLIEIGNDVLITHSTILAHDASTKNMLGKTKVGKVKIGDRVFVGYGSIILPNISIGDDVIIGAGTIVTKSIPSNSVVVGNPSRVVGLTSDFKKKHKYNMQCKPVYNTYWPNKTKQEEETMKIELENSIGYDE